MAGDGADLDAREAAQGSPHIEIESRYLPVPTVACPTRIKYLCGFLPPPKVWETDHDLVDVGSIIFINNLETFKLGTRQTSKI